MMSIFVVVVQLLRLVAVEWQVWRARLKDQVCCDEHDRLTDDARSRSLGNVDGHAGRFHGRTADSLLSLHPRLKRMR